MAVHAKRLTELCPGDKGVITRIEQGAGEIGRLCDMGINEGTSLRIVRYAPLGDPLEIKIRGFYLSIRKELAYHLVVNQV